MTTDLTFFTNEPDAALLDRFKATLRDVQFFDVLVGYFRTSGFYPTLADLENAFNIESVTREFFGRYKELFSQVREEVEGILARPQTGAGNLTQRSTPLHNHRCQSLFVDFGVRWRARKPSHHSDLSDPDR